MGLYGLFGAAVVPCSIMKMKAGCLGGAARVSAQLLLVSRVEPVCSAARDSNLLQRVLIH